MKEKFKRRHTGHLGTPANDYGKVNRSNQKSMRREQSHYLKNSSWFSFAGIIGVLSKLMTFLFNNTNSCTEGVRSFGPVLPQYVRQNNSHKRWYKTHIPKSMRKDLTHLETTQLRQKVYAGQVRYV